MRIYTACEGGALITKSCPTLATPWTVVCQPPLSMRFSRHEFWSGLPFSPSADCVLSELSTMTRPSRVALHGMAHGSLSYASPFATTKLSSMKGVFNLYLRFLYHIKQLYHSEFSLLRFHSSCNPLANSTT